MKRSTVIVFLSITLFLIVFIVAILLFFDARFSQRNENYQGYVLDNKITIGRTVSDTCFKSETENTVCAFSIPKNERIDIIYDNKNGWYYANWKYGKLSTWGWVNANTIQVR